MSDGLTSRSTIFTGKQLKEPSWPSRQGLNPTMTTPPSSSGTPTHPVLHYSQMTHSIGFSTAFPISTDSTWCWPHLWNKMNECHESMSPGRHSVVGSSAGRHNVGWASLTWQGKSPSEHCSQGSVSPHQTLEDTCTSANTPTAVDMTLITHHHKVPQNITNEWNRLPHHICALQSIDSFKAALKTYLFDCSWLNTHCCRDNATVVNCMVAARPCNVFVVLRRVRNCLTIIIIINEECSQPRQKHIHQQ